MPDKMKSLLNHLPGFITGETVSSFEEILSKSYPPTAINNAFKSVGNSMKSALHKYEQKTSSNKTPSDLAEINCD